MPPVPQTGLDTIYPRCRSAVAGADWRAAAALVTSEGRPEALIDALRRCGTGNLPDYLPDLARLEWALFEARNCSDEPPSEAASVMLNPTIRILDLSWTGLTAGPGEGRTVPDPSPGKERALLWRDPRSRIVRVRPASDEDLLVLKMTSESIPAETVAALGGLPIGAVDAAVDRAVRDGLLIAPPSRIRRDTGIFCAASEKEQEFLSSPSFTIQWHITQVCDLHCRHCYDRSDRSPLSEKEAIRILDELRAFCRDRNVQGAVSLTGGNPLLHPRFDEIYRAARERNFSTAILGNPASRERIEEIIRIGMPAFYQVSLEGLQEHDDHIRGAGHFERTLSFLQVLRELKVPSMVMLTLTESNLAQVISLAELLRERVDVFHFNRLALFGEGASLRMADRSRYRAFLEEYLRAAESNPVLGLKDNLLNILLRERGEALFGGCTGYGCGAAFNFVTLLADGEIHACRKLPSPLGNIRERTLAEIYDSELARRYRRGSSACRGCEVRIVCGGCLASTKSGGLDIFDRRDPFCFRPDSTMK